MAPTIIFGDIRGLSLEEIHPILKKYNITRLDSAAIYEQGDSERRLGASGWSKEFTIDTKILGGPIHSGALTPEKIDESSRLSLERLQSDKVNVLYCHIVDLKTPFEEQARGFDEVYKKGRFEALGVSNLMPKHVEEWLRIAKEKGYVKPTWFQGQYNLVCRSYEGELFPLLRKEGIHFAAFSPLAMGFLNGNLRPNNVVGQRFIKHAARSLALGYYDRPNWYDAFDKIEAIAKKSGIPTDELGLRWIMHHSQLRDDDILILGASKTHQIEQSLANLHKGPLPDDVAASLDALWTPEMNEEGVELIDPEKFKLG